MRLLLEYAERNPDAEKTKKWIDTWQSRLARSLGGR